MSLPASRRDCLRLLGAGLVASALPARLAAEAPTSVDACAADMGFTRSLHALQAEGWFARVAVGADGIAMRARTLEAGLAFEVAAGNRRSLAPTLVAAAGSRLKIALDNALPEPTVAHWHGLTNDTRNDGNGESLIAPGARFDYAFDVRNRGGLYWYHPHPHGATASQTYRGLFGMLEVIDDDEASLRRALGLEPGVSELTLALQDRRAGDGLRYAAAPEDELLGWYGCLPHVNGVLRPFLDVAGRRYRLRILNAANARTYRLAFRRDTGAALGFQLVGTDGGLLARALACTEVFVSPAERVDVLVDFAGIAKGGFVVMETRAFDRMQAVPVGAGGAKADEPAHGHAGAPSSVADGTPLDLMQFRIRESGAAGPAVPDVLTRMPAVPASASDERPLRLGFAKGRWRINDRVYDAQATPIVVARGSRETWLLRNYHASAPHAMHVHGYQFRVLERETSPDWLAPLAIDAQGRLPTDLGFKDTVLVWPGESVRIALDFALPFAGDQIYLVHCHNLEHEDGGMMLRVRVT
ncbi:MAG: multicopper oxidase family protein [Burkholderiales bacterium]